MRAINERPRAQTPINAQPALTRSLEQLLTTDRAISTFIAREPAWGDFPGLPAGSSIVPGVAGMERARALRQRERIPDRSASNVVQALAVAAVDTKPTPEVVWLIVGQLLSCFSGEKLGNPDMFLKTVVFDLVDLGFSDDVIAAGCVFLRRASKFRPSIAEIVEACQAKYNSIKGSASVFRNLKRRRDAIHDVLHHTGGDPDLIEVTYYCPFSGMESEYAKGSLNRYWYDPFLNEELLLQIDPTTGEDEAEEVWQARYASLKAAADAEPDRHRAEVARAYGLLDGQDLANALRSFSPSQRDRAFVERLQSRKRDAEWPLGFRRDVWRETVAEVVRDELDDPFLPRVERSDPDQTEAPDYWGEVQAEQDARVAELIAAVAEADRKRSEARP